MWEKMVARDVLLMRVHLDEERVVSSFLLLLSSRYAKCSTGYYFAGKFEAEMYKNILGLSNAPLNGPGD